MYQTFILGKKLWKAKSWASLTCPDIATLPILAARFITCGVLNWALVPTKRINATFRGWVPPFPLCVLWLTINDLLATKVRANKQVPSETDRQAGTEWNIWTSRYRVKHMGKVEWTLDNGCAYSSLKSPWVPLIMEVQIRHTIRSFHHTQLHTYNTPLNWAASLHTNPPPPTYSRKTNTQLQVCMAKHVWLIWTRSQAVKSCTLECKVLTGILTGNFSGTRKHYKI